MTYRFFILVCSSSVLALLLAYSRPAHAGVVEFKNNTLHIDGDSQPQLFGAEVQYFRLRGGDGRNISRAKVRELWNKALDRLVEIGANTIGFYIPWDFHEYAPGKFDFDGTVDEDGDGNPDYPSRDVKYWFELIEEKGIRIIHARPGPYINAEWGFLGFGSAPVWFHEKYPDSHMRNPRGQKTAMYSYADPNFLRHAKQWLTTVHKEVLAPHIGPDRPIAFLQIDNESNYMWQSLYNHDYSARAVGAYRDFLKAKYETLKKLNRAHSRSWKTWSEIQPPTEARLNVAEDQDWYRFQDEALRVYLHEIRKHWESIGVKEPNVLFTLAESYNAAGDGLLPNYKFRNERGKTGMMTVNLYPKTFTPGAHDPLLNTPFKADHDVKAADSANDFYLGQKQEWVMGPEIQGGWWRGTNVSPEARQQTYLTTLGHGLKALYVYYFHEGDNWYQSWALDQALPYYNRLRQDPRYQGIPNDSLPIEFWSELNATFADKVLAGWDLKYVFANGGSQPRELYFDAPLDRDLQPRPHYDQLKSIGTTVIVPHGRFLASATELTDPVCLVKDVESHVPTGVAGVSSQKMNAEWAAGLVGYFLHAGINPRIVHWGLNPSSELAGCKLLVYQDIGHAPNTFVQFLSQFVSSGGGALLFFDDSVLKKVTAPGLPNCEIVAGQSVDPTARKCIIGSGFVYHVKTAIHEPFNSDAYSQMTDIPERVVFLEKILTSAEIEPQIQVSCNEHNASVVGFARLGQDRKKMLVTIKNGLPTSAKCKVLWNGADPKLSYSVSRLVEGTFIMYPGATISKSGFLAGISPHGSDMFVIEPVLLGQ